MPMLSAGTEQGTPVEIYYEVYGAGKPVVLIHGWPLSGRSWEKQVPALVQADRMRLTQPTLTSLIKR